MAGLSYSSGIRLESPVDAGNVLDIASILIGLIIRSPCFHLVQQKLLLSLPQDLKVLQITIITLYIHPDRVVDATVQVANVTRVVARVLLHQILQHDRVLPYLYRAHTADDWLVVLGPGDFRLGIALGRTLQAGHVARRFGHQSIEVVELDETRRSFGGGIVSFFARSSVVGAFGLMVLERVDVRE